jgi:threonine dehydrogenase-like Zn-dependent dehydrogenase
VRALAGKPVTLEVPTIVPAEGEVRVRVASAGICGSDLHLLGYDLPVIMGHELAGTLDDGTPVAVEPKAPCGECESCRSGERQHCVRGPAMVLGVGRNGGMAEECVVPASALARLPAGLSLGDACVVEPLAVGVHGVRRGQIRPGDRVVVIGGGAVGLTALVAAQAAGATVDLVARHEHQRAAADRLGGGQPGDGYDVAIEAAGTADALADAIGRCRTRGRVVALGTYWEGTIPLPALELCMREIDLVPSSTFGRSGPSRDIDVAVALLAARPEVASTLITHRFPLDAAAEAFATARDRAAGAIKVVLEP